jgi:hypothetical protein
MFILSFDFILLFIYEDLEFVLVVVKKNYAIVCSGKYAFT